MFNQIAINSNTYSGFSLEEAVQGASRAGFSKIELAAVEHTPYVLTGMSDKEVNRIFNSLQENNFTGPISVEIEFIPDGFKDLAEIDESVKRAYGYLRKLLGRES